MKRKFGKRALLLAAVSIIIMVAGGGFYLSHMQHTLWEQSVGNMLEVTNQGAKAFEVYVEQGDSMLKGRAANFAMYNSTDVRKIKDKIDLYENGDPSFATFDLTHRIIYFNSSESLEIPDDMQKEYLSLPDHGILEPSISEYTGQRVLSYYEKFKFNDGAEGMVRKSELISDISERFSLSFYGDAGFSYIVGADGDIMLRAGNENVNHTFRNIFDVTALANNDNHNLEDFRRGMAEGKSGVMRLNFGGREHSFAFVPLDMTDGWYLISVVPNDVIMEHANRMLMSSQLILGVMMLAVFIFVTFVLMSIQHNRQVRAKETEVLYRDQLFDLLVKSTNDVFLMVSSDYSDVKYISPNVERVLGVPKEEVEKDISALQSVIHGIDNNDVVSSSMNIPMYGSESFEGNYIHKVTGEKRWYKETVYHNDIEDMERYIVILADCSEERKREAALTEALHIAEVANEAKSAFLANMSHDIRTPMNAIVGLATMLQRDADDPEKVREHTGKITSSSQHLLGLINDVLDMSKIENGKTSLNVGEFSLAKLINELDSIIRLQAKAKKQSFEIVLQDIHNENLMGDKQRISQVLVNILSNAVKYTPNGGNVRLVVQQLGQVTQDIVRIRFEVIDDGIGMSEEYQKVIFQPFTREIRTTVNQVQGTGLGMAITKNLVDLMGGTISVTSIQGEGSVFTIEFDLRVKHDNDDINFWKEHHISGALVVDDEEDICTEILSAMSGTGVSMQFALDGATAVKMVQAANNSGSDYDLILLDWKMPGMDGIETARQIRAIVPAHIPIMILTAYDWEEIREEGIAAGIDGFLSKPFFISNFKEVIRSVNKRERGVNPRSGKKSIAGCHFLCAEDNELNAEILVELLDMEGVTADLASDGQEAVDKFAASPEGRYDAVLMDVQMPVMNGYEATRAIRRLDHPQAKTIPIVAMTANAFADDVQAAHDAGMDAHLAKPVDMKKMVEVLTELCKKG